MLQDYVITLELGITWQSVTTAWRSQREPWLAAVAVSSGPKALARLISQFEDVLVPSASLGSWYSIRQRWKRQIQRVRTMADCAECLLLLEAHIAWSNVSSAFFAIVSRRRTWVRGVSLWARRPMKGESLVRLRDCVLKLERHCIVDMHEWAAMTGPCGRKDVLWMHKVLDATDVASIASLFATFVQETSVALATSTFKPAEISERLKAAVSEADLARELKVFAAGMNERGCLKDTFTTACYPVWLREVETLMEPRTVEAPSLVGLCADIVHRCVLADASQGLSSSSYCAASGEGGSSPSPSTSSPSSSSHGTTPSATSHRAEGALKKGAARNVSAVGCNFSMNWEAPPLMYRGFTDMSGGSSSDSESDALATAAAVVNYEEFLVPTVLVDGHGRSLVGRLSGTLLESLPIEIIVRMVEQAVSHDAFDMKIIQYDDYFRAIFEESPSLFIQRGLVLAKFASPNISVLPLVGLWGLRDSHLSNLQAFGALVDLSVAWCPWLRSPLLAHSTLVRIDLSETNCDDDTITYASQHCPQLEELVTEGCVFLIEPLLESLSLSSWVALGCTNMVTATLRTPALAFLDVRFTNMCQGASLDVLDERIEVLF